MCLSPLSFLKTASCWNWRRRGSLLKPPARPKSCTSSKYKLKHSSQSAAAGWGETAGQPARKVHGLTGIQVSTHHFSVKLTLTHSNTQSPLPPKTWCTSGSEHTFKFPHIRQIKHLFCNVHTHMNKKLCFLSLSWAMWRTSNTRWYHTRLGTNSAVSLIFTWLLST